MVTLTVAWTVQYHGRVAILHIVYHANSNVSILMEEEEEANDDPQSSAPYHLLTTASIGSLFARALWKKQKASSPPFSLLSL